MKTWLLGIVSALAILFSAVGAARADYWMYCQENPTVCWVASPTVQPTVVPSQSTDPNLTPAKPVDKPVVCPDGRVSTTGCVSGATATTDVNLRSGPGVNYPVVAVVPNGAQVSVLGYSGYWVQASFAGQTGYINSLYLLPA